MPQGKSNKRKSGGAEAAERKQQRLEERRQQKAEALARQRKAAARARAVRSVALIALAGVAFWFFFLRSSTPDEINGHAITGFGGTGVGDHTEQPVEYEMTPPVQGFHSSTPAPCGVHGAPILDENLVHSLEHGAVALFFDPARATPKDIKELEAIASDADENVVSAPYEGMEPVFAIASWGERMDLDVLDVDAVNEYIDTFAGKGPEAGQTCPNTVDTPYAPTDTPTDAPAESG